MTKIYIFFVRSIARSPNVLYDAWWYLWFLLTPVNDVMSFKRSHVCSIEPIFIDIFTYRLQTQWTELFPKCLQRELLMLIHHSEHKTSFLAENSNLHLAVFFPIQSIHIFLIKILWSTLLNAFSEINRNRIQLMLVCKRVMCWSRN